MKKVSKGVGLRRLLKLASYLRTIPRKQFNYAHWVGMDWKGAPDLSCGTTACALGWATTIPAFRRVGLTMSKTDFSPTLKGYGSDTNSFVVAEHFFGLTSIFDAFDLFSPKNSEKRATPKYVARKIERWVKEHSET